jgi:hypothetical protein
VPARDHGPGSASTRSSVSTGRLQYATVAADLANGRIGCGDDRRAAGHRLDDRQAEPFVQRRKAAPASSRQSYELVLRDEAPDFDAALAKSGAARRRLGPTTTSRRLPSPPHRRQERVLRPRSRR